MSDSFIPGQQYMGANVLTPFIWPGPPTSGVTLAGIAPRGAMLVDTTNGVLYLNTGSLASPTWTTISSSAPQAISVNLTSTQIKALHTTPITIVPAPGAGLMIQVLGFMESLTYGTQTYAIGSGSAGLYYQNSSGSIIDTNLLKLALVQTASGVYTQAPAALDAVAAANVANQPVVAASDTVNPTTGDGTCRITLSYTVVTL